MAFSFDTFMHKVRKGNWHFEWFQTSSLAALIDVVADYPGTRTRADVQAALNNVPADKQRKYSSAMVYLQAEVLSGNPQSATPAPSAALQRVQALGVPLLSHVGQQGLRAVQDREARVALQDIVVERSSARGNPIRQVMSSVGPPRNYTWDVRLRIRVTESPPQILVIVPVHAAAGSEAPKQIPANRASTPVTDSIRRNWSSRIAERWGGASMRLLNQSGTKVVTEYPIEFCFEWVESQAEASFHVYCVSSTSPDEPPDGTVDMMFWGAQDGQGGNSAIAHEFGHMIGNPDEYHTVDFDGLQVTNNGGIMMDVAAPVKPGHYYLIATAVCDGRTLPKARCRIRSGTSDYSVANNHPWR